MGTVGNLLSPDDEKKILSAIKEAESRTSGEIRVRIDRKAGKDIMASARKAFISLGMRKTKLHNGVIFFLATEDRQFVILGDDEINRKVPKGFWSKTRDVMQEDFRKGLFADGLAEGIKLAGEQLADFFPFKKDDVDELPNAISYANDGGGK